MLCRRIEKTPYCSCSTGVNVAREEKGHIQEDVETCTFLSHSSQVCVRVNVVCGSWEILLFYLLSLMT